MTSQPTIQRDLAIEPPHPAAVGAVLTPVQMQDAIDSNNRVLGAIDNTADIIQEIRDVIEISRLPAVVDEDFVNGVVQWQASFGLTQCGSRRAVKPCRRECSFSSVASVPLLTG